MKALTISSILCLVLLAFAGYARAQTNVFPASGNVGIGTTSPGFNLDIQGIQTKELHLMDAGDVGFQMTGDGSTNMFSIRNDSTYFVSLNTQNGLPLSLGVSTGSGATSVVQQFTIVSNGNVGIGTTSPTDLGVGAHTVQSVGANPYFIADASAGNPGYMWFSGGTEKWRIDDLTSASDRLRIYNPTSGEVVSILQGGNVGIGTTDPSYPLTVNGTIRAKEVIVDTGWSDYVFNPHHRLEPLAQVACYINTHHHLPGIPTAKEVKAGGISLGQMQAQLLAKVEELTLHQIEQAKAISTLEKENAELRQQIRGLKTGKR